MQLVFHMFQHIPYSRVGYLFFVVLIWAMASSRGVLQSSCGHVHEGKVGNTLG